ncbi:MAG TPA: Asp-tRNA(Asn)/Glu-tRNA(Gln) amidotransferase subunit GatC [Steroidobacteraceae bacterium]|jgi:aspartyl-tRNA(Asn)/glutamyl-tRNA(Gln) amidotransferase subunit C|nr:Asp-tRNA(Asn)/Glu-tRNA(Gln) amidotransferase subunit GatC [Steroidobacteraceae bacterium]
MNITREQVESIARLARLSLASDEAPQYAEGLSRVLALVEQLQGVDTTSVTPMAHPLPGQRARLRADEVRESDRHELYQRNAPQVEAALYLVPRVIE